MDDSLRMFVNERATERAQAKSALHKLYDRYRSWCVNHDVKPVSRAVLIQELKEYYGNSLAHLMAELTGD